MHPFDFSYILYFFFVYFSIGNLITFGLLYTDKTGKKRPVVLHEPKAISFILIWGIFYLIAIFLEFLGHIIGVWKWYDTEQIFLHGAFWWATLLSISVIILSSMKQFLRYITLLESVLIFEFLQESLVQWVTHTPIGTPYVTITIVMCLVCSTSFFASNLLIKLRLLKPRE